MTETEPQKQYCPKHPEVELETRTNPSQFFLDDDGNERESGEYDETFCPECEEEELFSKYEEGPKAERYLNKKISNYEEQNDFKPHTGLNLILRLMDLTKDTDAAENPRKSMALFMISSQLNNATSANSKGTILANLGFILAEPAGTNKTPLLVSGYDNHTHTLYANHLHYNTGTAKGFKKNLTKFYKEGDPHRFPCEVTWDEAQDIISMMRQEALADIYSFFCQMIDNRLQSYHTVERGEERYPPLYTNIWLSGVPELLEKTQKNFWFQGIAMRFLFVRSEGLLIKPIQRAKEGSQNTKEIESLIADLKLLNFIKYVKYTDAYLDAYNEYRMEILEEVQKVESLDSSQEIENFPILSRKKYPVIVWKLAIVHAASRGNFDKELLIMDKEDLEAAIKDLEEYNANMLVMFDYWQEHSTKDQEIKTANKWINKFRKHFKTLYGSDKMFRLEVDKNTEPKTTASWVAIPDPSGKWIDGPMLSRYSNMAKTDFDHAMETLDQMEYMVGREAKVRDKKGGYGLRYLYKWRDEEKK